LQISKRKLMSNILIIDTANAKLSLALLAKENIVGQYLDASDYSHARNITLEIEKMLSSNSMKISNLDAVAVNEGPGSFTGLRVGSSIAKGICFGLEIPLIKINGLEAYAKYFYKALEGKYQDIFILLDARRDNYFFAHSSMGEIQTQTTFLHIDEIEKKINESLSTWVYNSKNEGEVKLQATFLAEEVLNKWKNKDFEDISSFEPQYLLNNYQAKK